MENNQSIQHELTQERRPKAERKDSQSVVIISYKVFMYLLTRHPLLLLTGLFTTLLGTAALALYNIAYVSGVEQVKPVPAVREEPIITNFENAKTLPLWMVAAIALSCASGCSIIFRLLNEPIKDSQLQKRQATTNKVKVPSTQPRQFQPESQHLKKQPVFTTIQPLPPIITLPSINKPAIAVLPPEQKNPFDDSKESLSDLLDWRKYNSLTAILQQYSS